MYRHNISFQATWRTNRGSISGYFLAGREMLWFAVSYPSPNLVLVSCHLRNMHNFSSFRRKIASLIAQPFLFKNFIIYCMIRKSTSLSSCRSLCFRLARPYSRAISEAEVSLAWPVRARRPESPWPAMNSM